MRAGIDPFSSIEAGTDAGHSNLAVLREASEQMKDAAALAQGVEMQTGIGHRIDQIHRQQPLQAGVNEVVGSDVMQGGARLKSTEIFSNDI